jgi:DNA-binding NarL/FixJ family response regulator
MVSARGEERPRSGGNGFEQYSPAIIILDIAMSVMNGVEAAELLLDKASHAQIIMCSL